MKASAGAIVGGVAIVIAGALLLVATSGASSNAKTVTIKTGETWRFTIELEPPLSPDELQGLVRGLELPGGVVESKKSTPAKTTVVYAQKILAGTHSLTLPSIVQLGPLSAKFVGAQRTAVASG